MSLLTFRAVAIKHADWGIPGQGLAGYFLKPSPEVIDFQNQVEPLPAYVTDANDPEIDHTTLNFVEQYVPNHSGSNYIAHLTLGFATLDDLKIIETKPFNEFDIDPSNAAVFHLGKNGTARKELKSFTF